MRFKIMYIIGKLVIKPNYTYSDKMIIVGLINMQGISWDEKESLIKKEPKMAMNENNEIFSKAR